MNILNCAIMFIIGTFVGVGIMALFSINNNDDDYSNGGIL